MTGNGYSSNCARQFEAPTTETLLTVMDHHLYCIYQKLRHVVNLSVGRVGMPKACQAYAKPVYDPLTTFLAEYRAGLQSAFEMLLMHAGLRRRMGAAWRKKLEEHYSHQVWGPRVAQMLRSVADEGRRA